MRFLCFVLEEITTDNPKQRRKYFPGEFSVRCFLSPKPYHRMTGEKQSIFLKNTFNLLEEPPYSGVLKRLKPPFKFFNFQMRFLSDSIILIMTYIFIRLQKGLL